MKKLICALMCAVMLLGLMPSVFALKNGDVVDAVLHTDIVTYINGTPIESYNIKGYTAVKVEDLMGRRSEDAQGDPTRGKTGHQHLRPRREHVHRGLVLDGRLLHRYKDLFQRQ